MNAANFRLLVLFTLLQNATAPAIPGANLNEHPSLTVLMDFESPHSEASFAALRQSLNQLLSPGGISVDVQLREELPSHPQFGQLVVFKMRGSCSLSPLPIGALSDERGPLAMAYTSDGQVLHFGEVECDRVRHSVQRILGANSSPKSQQTYGSALAVVIAHEVYHMLGNAKTHTRGGLTKPGLSSADLLDRNLSLPPSALASIEKCMHGGPPARPK